MFKSTHVKHIKHIKHAITYIKMFIVMKVDGDRESVCALYNDLSNATIFAWKCTLNEFTHRDFYIKYWCDPSVVAEKRRLNNRETGIQYLIIHWDMLSNLQIGSYYLDVKPLFITIGKQGESAFKETINEYLMDIGRHMLPVQLCEHINYVTNNDQIVKM